MSSKKTVVFGASPNPGRYSHVATNMLADYGHEVLPLGIRKGYIGSEQIITEWPEQINGLDTLTLYMNPSRQREHYDYLISLKPKRMVFNPGTENRELEELARDAGIEVEEACTLVLLRTGQY